MSAGDLEIVMAELRKVAAQPEAVTADANVTQDLGLDSLAVMNVVMVLEDTFDMLIPMDRLAEVQTVKDLANLVGTLQKSECA